MAQLVTPPVPTASFVNTANGFLVAAALKFLTNITNALNGSATSTGATFVNFGNGVTLYKGVGSPQNVVPGNVGDLYVSSAGGAGTTLYCKQSGTPGSKGGWAALT
jgi:hypothetical protein